MGGLIHSSYQASPYPSAQNPQQAIDQYNQDVARKSQIYQGQQDLAQTFKNEIAGNGPNPAQTQYLQNVGNNIANSQGLIASQRGLNPALAARMGANAASAANNQAGLGSALLQQQQQLNATQGLEGLYGQMQGGNLGYINQQNQMDQAANQINAGVAQGNASNNAAIFGGLTNAIGGAGALYGAGKLLGKSQGGFIDGIAKVSGDSQSNDTVPAMLSPGEIVLPRSVAHDPEKAKEFVDHLLESEKKNKVGYGDVLKARRKKAA
jgi:hypothetical protein